MSIPVPILDAHIHLFPASELPTLAWNDPSHPLWAQHSLAEYRRATLSSHDLLSGFIFLETDRRNDENDPRPEGGWKHTLQEVSWLARIAGGRPRAGEGHAPGDRDLCKGIVPWAPVAAGEEVLGEYIEAVRETCLRDGGGDESVWKRVKGFRYLLQDKPERTMLDEKFVEGVRLLGRKGLVFDVGVDQHRRGRSQLEEVVELVERAHEGVKQEDKVIFILNHLCKPDLTQIDPQTDSHPETDPGFIAWRTAMFTLSKADNVYMKLSGAFSEMSPALAGSSANQIFEAIHPWLAVVVATFGPGRIMFGSDWPVCTVGLETRASGETGQGTGVTEEGEGAWDKWRKVVERMCDLYSFDEEQTRMIFAGTARRAYGIE